MKNFNNNEFVIFDNGFNAGTGFVVGVSSTELPVIGRGMIIKVKEIRNADNSVCDLPWDCIAVH